MHTAKNGSDTDTFVNPFPLSGEEYEYWSDAHRLAAEQLDFAIGSNAPLTLFTGKAGLGKSMVLRRLVHEVQGHCLIGIMPQQRTFKVLRRSSILRAFGAHVARGQADIPQETLTNSIRSAAGRLGCPTLVIDEAHAYPDDTLRELIGISEISGNNILFKLLFVGRPELAERMRAIGPDFAAPSIELGPMSEEDTSGYIHHRFAVAGYPYFPLSKDALAHICTESKGNPLTVNLVCMTALDEAHARGMRLVDADLARSCCEALGVVKVPPLTGVTPGN